MQQLLVHDAANCCIVYKQTTMRVAPGKAADQNGVILLPD